MPTTTDTAVPVQEAFRMARDGARLIDVREPFEYQGGHAPGAESVPLNRLASSQAAVPTTGRVLLVCASGNRSGMATQLLRQRGVDAINVDGGMAAWTAAGLPVER